MTKRDPILTPHGFDAFIGFDKARDEHAERIRKALADAGLPRPHPDYEDYDGDEVMARLGEWLGLYNGFVRNREAGNASEMAWRLERMGEIRGELVWRYGVADWETGVVPDDAVAFKQKNILINRERGTKGTAVTKKMAARWQAEAQAEAELLWERRPELRNSLTATAEAVRRKLRLDKSVSTIRQALQKLDRVR